MDSIIQHPTFGAGRMGRMTAEFNWASTPLGPISSWSKALEAIVSLMLGQRHPICMFWGEQFTMLYNDAYAPLLGAKEHGALGQPANVVWSDIWSDIKPFVDQAMSGDGTWAEELPLVMTRNGFDEETFWTFSYSPLFEEGEVKGMMNVAIDATAGVIARRNQNALQRELVHRVKNTLAVAGAVVSSTLRQATSLEQARATVADRITALGNAQELLHESAEDTPVRGIVEAAMKAHLDRPDRAVISGPDTRVASQQAVGLSLAVYELATNAVKYGALSDDAGKVEISWDLTAGDRFTFTWQEVGGPAVAKPARTGFGSRLTNKIVAAYFEGQGRTLYNPDGVRFELEGIIHSGQSDQVEIG
ncbi:sensor histidine kinase [Neorhizobium sp. JUb45]|uniref:sensor histidine kinase n=1 Tax=unclassified Neorhizobium TaxID=2629175 RepID=UPI0010D0E529|nr:sensor histidine kinase [Neorhizobium sp. JUb45]TCQ96770.1 two-component sensor histidine kinase [Neorhizobium sp. JUb45]